MDLHTRLDLIIAPRRPLNCPFQDLKPSRGQFISWQCLFFGGKKTVFVFVFQENPRKKIVFEFATISRAWKSFSDKFDWFVDCFGENFRKKNLFSPKTSRRSLLLLYSICNLSQHVCSAIYVSGYVNDWHGIPKYLDLENKVKFSQNFLIFFKLPPYTPAGFYLTTHNSAGGDDATRPRRKGQNLLIFLLLCLKEVSDLLKMIHTYVHRASFFLRILDDTGTPSFATG
jgi:hypothetical protein